MGTFMMSTRPHAYQETKYRHSTLSSYSATCYLTLGRSCSTISDQVTSTAELQLLPPAKLEFQWVQVRAEWIPFVLLAFRDHAVSDIS